MTEKVIHDIFMDQAVQNPQARALSCRGMDPTSYQYTPYTRREIKSCNYHVERGIPRTGKQWQGI